jgi:hypothetical protein
MREADFNQKFDDLIETCVPGTSLKQDGTNGYLQNYEALEFLKKKQTEWNNILATSGDAAVSFGMPLPTRVETTGAHIGNEPSIPIDRLVSVMEMLLEEFKEEGIIITPQVKTEKGTIDLIVRTADGRYFVLILRSNGYSQVRWREERQEFFVRRKRQMSKWSGIEPLGHKLNDAMMCLKEQKNQLVAATNNERKKGFTKVIVLTGKTSLDLTRNDPALLVDFGLTKALRVKTESTFYLVNKTNLADFLRQPKKIVPSVAS